VDDFTFLRNLADRGRVVLLADGSAVPVPRSVLDDDTRAGGTFSINLISPEEIESGDRRTFAENTVEHRPLPIPLLWQWQLQDGHKTAVVVGRIDYLEKTPEGLGNARGVFDDGPWGREAERMVRKRMLRGVSGDYSNFDAQVLEKVEPEDNRLLDDKIRVQKSQLVAATIVAKPAFEGCYIQMTDDPAAENQDADTYDYPDGVIEAQVPITASALVAAGRTDLVLRLERLEQLEAQYQMEELAVVASAVKGRVSQHRLAIEREDAVARVRAARNMTAAWHPLSRAFLSAKAKAQPRDKNGRWIDMGAMVRWVLGIQVGGHKGKNAPGPSGVPGQQKYMSGRVTGFDSRTKKFTVEPVDGSPKINLEGKDLEVVKAVIPETPEEARRFAEPHPNAPNAPDPQKSIQQRAGLTDKDMADAPPPIQSVEDFRQLSESLDGFSPQDASRLNNYLDEVQTVKDGRSAGQMDSIQGFLDETDNSLNTGDEQKLRNAFDKMKKDVLDSPGDTTIEDLKKQKSPIMDPQDLPDTSPGALTVPDDLTTPVDSPEDQVKKLLDGVGESIKKEYNGKQKAVDEAVNLMADKILQNDPDMENLSRLHKALANIAERNYDVPLPRLNITDADGNLTKTFHNLGLDDEGQNHRASDGESFQNFERRVAAGEKFSDRTWLGMNNEVVSYGDEIDSHEYDQLKAAWDELKKKANAPDLADEPNWAPFVVKHLGSEKDVPTPAQVKEDLTQLLNRAGIDIQDPAFRNLAEALSQINTSSTPDAVQQLRNVIDSLPEYGQFDLDIKNEIESSLASLRNLFKKGD
jgi:hypothetical protein